MPSSEAAKLLVVDDDAGVRTFLTLALQSEGYSVRSANDGRQALQRLAGWEADLALVDVEMPIMNGIDLLHTLRAHGDRTPVAFMSAGSNARDAAVAHGADGYLAKPFQLDELLALVAHLASDGRIRRPHDLGADIEATRTVAENAETTGTKREKGVSEGANPITVVAISANDANLQLLDEVVRQAGFDVVTARAADVGRSIPAIQDFLRRHNARVVVYEVAPPYAESWRLLNELRYAEMMSGSWRQYVITTPDKRALEEQVGHTGTIELDGGRGDRATLTLSVQRGVLV